MNDFNINNTILGKKAGTPEKYDASLLFAIPRSENRERYDLQENNLPFTGFDVWNCYEFSFLTDNGLPVNKMLKLVYPCNSPFLVESKSLKLYLNSFNMDRFGKTVQEAETAVYNIIKSDLQNRLKTTVQLSFFDEHGSSAAAFSAFTDFPFNKLVPTDVQETIQFNRFSESPELLRSEPTAEVNEYRFRSDLLRSNCRVTFQPDWGDIFVYIKTGKRIDFGSVLQYLVSFRQENHFHEEVVEMIYKRFLDYFEPEKLMVAAMYTRRGGIDINPVRASHPELIDTVLISEHTRVLKNLRQ